MTSIPIHPSLVAYCGLYCGACPSFVKGRCPGCHDNKKATWCKVRTCNIEHGNLSCADCQDFSCAKQCGRFNNFISRVVGFVLRSDRAACIKQIKALGLRGHAEVMAKLGRQSLPRGRA